MQNKYNHCCLFYSQAEASFLKYPTAITQRLSNNWPACGGGVMYSQGYVAGTVHEYQDPGSRYRVPRSNSRVSEAQ